MNIIRRLLGLEARDEARVVARAEILDADVHLDEARRASTAAVRKVELLERRAAIIRRRAR